MDPLLTGIMRIAGKLLGDRYHKGKIDERLAGEEKVFGRFTCSLRYEHIYNIQRGILVVTKNALLFEPLGRVVGYETFRHVPLVGLEFRPYSTGIVLKNRNAVAFDQPEVCNSPFDKGREFLLIFDDHEVYSFEYAVKSARNS